MLTHHKSRFFSSNSLPLLFLLFLFTSGAYADDEDDAVNASAEFVKALTDGSLETIYEQTSPRFQAAVTSTLFKERIGMMRIQLDGPLQQWTLKGAQSLSQWPATGEVGAFYFVRLIATYPSLRTVYDLALDKTTGTWRVFWYNSLPAPPQS